MKKTTALQAIEKLLIETDTDWLEGTASSLLYELNRQTPTERRCGWWPKSASALSAQLDQSDPFVNHEIVVKRRRTYGRKLITIELGDEIDRDEDEDEGLTAHEAELLRISDELEALKNRLIDAVARGP